MSKISEYDYVVIGAGIAGCSTAYFLSKYTNSILLVDKNEKIAYGASGAAGAFLSPLLGKPNAFKDLVSKSLTFSTSFYKQFDDLLINCGVCRIPKSEEDRVKFDSYKPYMDFDYETMNDGYFFPIGSQINPSEICTALTKNISKKFNFNIDELVKLDDNSWLLNKEVKAKNIILTTGADTRLIKEKYFNIRAVWGQKIDITTTSNPKVNYHKECSVSKAVSSNKEKNLNKVSLGATHHRFDCDKDICNYCVEVANLNSCSRCYTSEITNKDSQKLISLANDIIELKDVDVIDVKIGARASSVDYFPMVGQLVDSEASITKFPHILNGTFIKEENLEMIKNLYVVNGVGGRGFVLSPYLANALVENIINGKTLDKNITTHRLFKRWAKRLKNKK